MTSIQRLKNDYPWIQTPLIIGAPMRLIALADLAVEISKAGTHPPTTSTPTVQFELEHQATPLTLPRRPRLHRRRHRRLLAGSPPRQRCDAAISHAPSDSKRPAAHRRRLHQLGRRPCYRTPAARALPPRGCVVLRAALGRGAGGLDGARQGRVSGHEGLGPGWECKGGGGGCA